MKAVGESPATVGEIPAAVDSLIKPIILYNFIKSDILNNLIKLSGNNSHRASQSVKKQYKTCI